MTRDLVVFLKLYIGSAFDLFLFALAAWEGADHVLRTISAIGGILVLIYLIRKYQQDYKLKKLDEEIKLLNIKKLKKQTKRRKTRL